MPLLLSFFSERFNLWYVWKCSCWTVDCIVELLELIFVCVFGLLRWRLLSHIGWSGFHNRENALLISLGSDIANAFRRVFYYFVCLCRAFIVRGVFRFDVTSASDVERFIENFISVFKRNLKIKVGCFSVSIVFGVIMSTKVPSDFCNNNYTELLKNEKNYSEVTKNN